MLLPRAGIAVALIALASSSGCTCVAGLDDYDFTDNAAIDGATDDPGADAADLRDGGPDATRPGYFVALKSSSILVSTDGRSWTAAPLPDGGPSSYSWAAGGGGNVVVVGPPFNGPGIVTVFDGAQWQRRSVGSDGLNAAVFDGARFAVLTARAKVLTTATPGTGPYEPSDLGGGDVRAIAYGNGRYVVVGENQLATSTDAKTWTKKVLPAGLSRVAFGNGVFLGVSESSGFRIVTTDGDNWQDVSDDAGQGGYGLVFSDGRFLIRVCEESLDGRTWTIRGNCQIPRSVAYGSGVYVWARNDGALFRSADRVTTERVAGIDGGVDGVFFVSP